MPPWGNGARHGRPGSSGINDCPPTLCMGLGATPSDLCDPLGVRPGEPRHADFDLPPICAGLTDIRNNPRAMAGEDRPWEAPFTERAFYLADFRERTLAIAGDADALADPAPIRSVFAQLEQNRTRIILLTSEA